MVHIFRNSVARFAALRPQLRALVSMYWVYLFTSALLGVFLQVYLYDRFGSIGFNMAASMVQYTGMFLGFTLFGQWVSLRQAGIKCGFAASLTFAALSVIGLLVLAAPIGALGAMFLNGAGAGLFWLTVHTLEIAATRDEERDFYASAVGAGVQVLAMAGPAAATFLIFTSGKVLRLGDFTLLFAAAAGIYCLGFAFLSRIEDYHPQAVTLADVRHFFADRRNRSAHLYIFGQGSMHVLQDVVIALSVFFILGTALRVGLYGTVLASLSACVLVVVAHYRKTTNRLAILGIATGFLGLLTVWLGYQFSFAALVIYTIGESLFLPLIRTSQHLIDLQTVESVGRQERDFFATLLLREVMLWSGRIGAGAMFLVLISFAATPEEYLATGLYLTAGALVLMYAGAHRLVKGVHHSTRPA